MNLPRQQEAERLGPAGTGTGRGPDLALPSGVNPLSDLLRSCRGQGTCQGQGHLLIRSWQGLSQGCRRHARQEVGTQHTFVQSGKMCILEKQKDSLRVSIVSKGSGRQGFG